MDKIEQFSTRVMGVIEDSYDSIIGWLGDLLFDHPKTIQLGVLAVCLMGFCFCCLGISLL